MKIIFAGTPEFAAIALEKLIASSYDVIGVYTQPDRPKGRGLKVAQSPVKELALAKKIPLFQPSSLKDSAEQKKLADLNADVMVVASYGLLLPSAVLTIPRLGCINIHPSLLPRWRGAAPLQRTIEAGDKVTGVTIMQMDEGLDTGPMLLKKEYTLVPHETYLSLHDKLAKIGAEALLETLDLLHANKITPQAQDNSKSTYASKISKEEALIDWQDPAEQIEQMVNAFNPWPVAYTSWKNQNLRIWEAITLPEKTTKEPRTIIDVSKHGIDVATGNGILRLLKLQLPGGKVMSVTDFYNSKNHELKVGEKFI